MLCFVPLYLWRVSGAWRIMWESIWGGGFGSSRGLPWSLSRMVDLTFQVVGVGMTQALFFRARHPAGQSRSIGVGPCVGVGLAGGVGFVLFVLLCAGAAGFGAHLSKSWIDGSEPIRRIVAIVGPFAVASLLVGPWFPFIPSWVHPRGGKWTQRALVSTRGRRVVFTLLAFVFLVGLFSCNLAVYALFVGHNLSRSLFPWVEVSVLLDALIAFLWAWCAVYAYKPDPDTTIPDVFD